MALHPSTGNETGRPTVPLARCLDCDLLQRGPDLRAGDAARCSRCGAVLYRQKANSLERTLGLMVAALVLWVLANVYPFMTFEFKGQSESNVILSGVIELYMNGAVALAAVILFTSIVAPIIYIGGMLYVLAPIRLGWQAPGATVCFRVLTELRAWSMLEVYLLGVMVAVIKLNQLASIEPGVAMGAFAVLIIVWSASQASLDPRVVWRALERTK